MGTITLNHSTESNIRQAIAACREERQDLLHNREEMQMVKESLEEGYCDVAGRVSDLAFIGPQFLCTHLEMNEAYICFRRDDVGCEGLRYERSVFVLGH